ncbi:MAG: P-loop NTPase fold protein [Bacteroidota bacterium]|nr:P-loop NTPase fold protein [Bacteroidota bacterium]MDP3145982.1 P-loop NTPase fold protein [Bacteroidota bacterium]
MKNKYQFLKNEPIGKDLFEGKGQERISDVVVEILKDERFKVIGIDGGWGTGKSNLVKIIDDKLKEHKFFIYDVWGHQEDEQRKAILSELTDFIKDRDNKLISDPTKWDEKLNTLLSKEKKIITTNQPHLSIGFILSLLLIIYVPTINTFAKNLSLCWQITLVLLPIILGFAFFIYKLYFIVKKYSDSKDFKNQNTKTKLKRYLFETSQEVFKIYNNQKIDETKIELSNDREPSVRDFRNWMKEIDNDLKSNVVIVFDNFDRLPKKNILSIWSVIHIFFAEPKYKRIKIIIPFDRLHIKNAFKELNADGNDYANDYINKTFDIVYRVAPPIMSSWKNFFKENWGKAFPSFEEMEYIKVEQAYEALRPNITPREIIVFINEVVTLKILDNSIPDRYTAVFVLNKENIIEKPLQAVTDLAYLKGVEYTYREDTDFQKYITALAYQIKPENALEVVYKKELKDCLVNNDSDRCNEISKTEVFSRIVWQTINEIENYKNPIKALNTLNEDAKISPVELQSLWNDIYLKQSKNEQEKIELEDYQTILLEKIDPIYKEAWLKLIIKNLYVKDNDFNAKTLADQIDRLDNFCIDKKISFSAFNVLQSKDVDLAQFKLVVNSKRDLYTKYKLNCPEQTVKEFLSQRTFENFQEADFIFHLKYREELTDFHNLLKTFVTDRENNIPFLNTLFQYLKKTTKTPIQNPLQDAHIHNLMSQISIGDPFFVDLTCMRIKLGVNSDPGYVPIYEKALNSDDAAFYKFVAEELEYYIGIEELLISSIQFQNKLIKGVIPILLGKDIGKRDLNTRNILQNLTSIATANNVSPEEIFLELDKYNVIALDYNFVFGLNNDELFKSALVSNSTIAKQIINELLNHFKTANAETWNGVFNSLNSRELQILKIIEFKEWSGFALESFGKKLIKIAQEDDSADLDNIPLITQSIENSGKSMKNTYKNLRDEFISSNKISAIHFPKFIGLLFKYSSLEDKAAEVIRTIFKLDFLDNAECLRIMQVMNKEIKNLLEKCSHEAKSDFINGVLARITIAEIKILAENLGIEIPKNEPDDTTQQ